MEKIKLYLKKTLKVAVCAVLIAIFLAGTVFVADQLGIMLNAVADTPKELPLGRRYDWSTIRTNGHEFVVFESFSGDIEVVKLN